MFSRFRRYIFIQGFAVGLVVILFKIFSDKKVASVFASSAFALASFLVAYLEIKKNDFKKHFTFWSTLIFVVCFIGPIIILRALSWENEFNTAELFGLTGQRWHQISNYGFMLMLACYFIDSLRESIKKQALNK